MKTIHKRQPVMATTTLLLSCLFTLFTTPTKSDTHLPIADKKLTDLGVQFSTVNTVTQENGFRVPAWVINSPENRSSITTRFNGTIDKWHIAGGQHVTKDQIIVSITSPPLIDLEQDWLAALQNQAQAKSDWDRDQDLHDSGIISSLRLQKAQRLFTQTQTRTHALQQQLIGAGLTPEDLTDIKEGTLELGKLSLRAACTGWVSRLNFQTGDPIPVNQPLAYISDSSDLWLRSSVNLSLAHKLNIGDQLTVLPGPFKASLKSKNQAISERTQAIDILAQLEQETTLSPGQQITIVIRDSSDTVFIPASAVTYSGNSSIIYVKSASGVEARIIDLVPMGDGYAADHGIDINEQIATQGTAILKGIQMGLGGTE